MSARKIILALLMALVLTMCMQSIRASQTTAQFTCDVGTWTLEHTTRSLAYFKNHPRAHEPNAAWREQMIERMR